MKGYSIGFVLLQLAPMGYAAPGAARMEARQQFGSAVTFQGAGPNPPSYTVSVPYDGSTFTIDNPLSVSHIISDDTNSGVCTFFGVDGSVTVLSRESTADVGPPQQIASGSCTKLDAIHKPRVFHASFRFCGAGSNPPCYTQAFPTDLTPQVIDNPLSVSTISAGGGGFCVFLGIDGSENVVYGEETVDVGPPQVLVSGTCDIA